MGFPSIASTPALLRNAPRWIIALVAGIVLLLAIGVVALAMVRGGDGGDPVQLIISDAAGQPVAGAEVKLGSDVLITDDAGFVAIPGRDWNPRIEVSHDTYEPRAGTLDLDAGSRQRVTLESRADEPEVADLPVTDTQAASAGAATGQHEQSEPDSAQDMATTSTPEPTGTPQSVSTPVAAEQFTGRVLGDEGQPLQGARVVIGEEWVVTGADGAFAIDIAGGQTARVFSPGYMDLDVPLSEVDGPQDVSLEPFLVKGIYYNPNITRTEEDLDRLIQLINDTELNAVVIDVKEELVFYDTQVQLFRDAEVVVPILDLPTLLQRFHENGIYTIARHVVFKDGLVAEHRPDLAVTNVNTGALWRDMNGVAWVNPMVRELWDANIELAVELADLGFDEIQYDYVRFPTDGDLTTMNFGLPNTEENRNAAITKFLDQSHQALIPTGTKLSADVFGYTVLVDDDLGIGQNFINLAPYVDYLSPMVYPSHFPDGSLALGGHPNDFPYETIDISMRAGAAKLDGETLQLRPWLQDFDFPGMMAYEDAEVRAQIDASEDTGASGWLLWDPNNRYTPGALEPDDGVQGTIPLATPQATPDPSAEGTPAVNPDATPIATPAG